MGRWQECLGKTETETGATQLQAQEGQGLWSLPEVRKRQDSTQNLRGSRALPTPSFQTLGLNNEE